MSRFSCLCDRCGKTMDPMIADSSGCSDKGIPYWECKPCIRFGRSDAAWAVGGTRVLARKNSSYDNIANKVLEEVSADGDYTE